MEPEDKNIDDRYFQEYQEGYHVGYRHGIMDASKITYEDAKLLSDIEYDELVVKDNFGKTTDEIYKTIVERFYKERKICHKAN